MITALFRNTFKSAKFKKNFKGYKPLNKTNTVLNEVIYYLSDKFSHLEQGWEWEVSAQTISDTEVE